MFPKGPWECRVRWREASEKLVAEAQTQAVGEGGRETGLQVV